MTRETRTMKTVKAAFSKSVSCTSIERNSTRQPISASPPRRFEEAGGGDPVFVLEVATALRYEGEALRWPLRCTYAQVDRLNILCYQLEPELRIIEFPKPAGTGFFKSLHTKSADRGSKVAKWVMALVARPELSAEVQTELLRFLGVYDDGRLPDGMLLWATPDASGRLREIPPN